MVRWEWSVIPLTGQFVQDPAQEGLRFFVKMHEFLTFLLTWVATLPSRGFCVEIYHGCPAGAQHWMQFGWSLGTAHSANPMGHSATPLLGSVPASRHCSGTGFQTHLPRSFPAVFWPSLPAGQADMLWHHRALCDSSLWCHIANTCKPIEPGQPLSQISQLELRPTWQAEADHVSRCRPYKRPKGGSSWWSSWPWCSTGCLCHSLFPHVRLKNGPAALTLAVPKIG